ncbi:MAG: UDP-N-acetylmuramate dehydrogenase [Firmicutes bacterium]|nr:UDP-N-acetylmuramate dehydrogenase [Bacillota bacterium]
MHHVEKLQAILKSQVRVNEPLSRHTTLKVGGPAAIFVEPIDRLDIQNVLRFDYQHKLPYFVIGNGSNLLARDEGFKGIVLKLSHSFCYLRCIGELAVVGAGTPLPPLVTKVAEKGLAGLEFACGIPGTVGGAAYMNAGAHGKEIGELLEEVVMVSKEGESKIAATELSFGYRYCSIQKIEGLITEVSLKLSPGEPYVIRQKIELLQQVRKKKQPRLPNAGSVFRNPPQCSAGHLIEEAGLKGLRIGDAQISEIHANFIVNLGKARASDIFALISAVREKVKEKFGIDLELEIKILDA